MQIDTMLAALADPTRRELLRRLAGAPRRAGVLAEGFGISRPAIVKHTRMLRRAGLVRVRKRGRERIYELAPHGGERMHELMLELEQVGHFWDTALAAFKRHLEKREETT